MSQTKRKPFVGGNWKCTGNRASIEKLVSGLNAAKASAADVCVAPSFLHLDQVKNLLDKRFILSAQNCSRFEDGAFTGDFGINWVILGHSERRGLFGDAQKLVGEKVALALKNGLNVIACIGETLEQRKAGKTEAVLQSDLAALAGPIGDQWSRIVIAYEPVWAIGTGAVATPEQAQDVHAFIRNWIRKNISASVADSVRIIYGGSVKASNSAGLISKRDIDGFLVGGASTVAADFNGIIDSIQSKL